MRHILPVDQIPLDLPAWQGITPEKLQHVLLCLQAQFIQFDAHDTIKAMSGKSSFLALLVTGRAVGVTYGEDGSRSILHEYVTNQVISCGTVFDIQCIPNMDVIACDSCRLVYFNTENPKVKCERCARYVNIVKGNLAQAMTDLNAELMVTLDIRSRRTVRGKIIAFLEKEQRKNGSDEFNIAFTRQELADYLCVDRATLSRELANLQDEGQISFKGSHFSVNIYPKVKRYLAS